MNRIGSGVFAVALSALAACGKGPSATPPAEIARACVSTNFGYDVLFAPEWVKPLMMAGGVGSWETSDQGVIFRIQKDNPLNGETTLIAMLFAPVDRPVKTADYCEGYYEPVLADVNGEAQPVAALKSQMYGLHMLGLGHYGANKPAQGPYTLEYDQ